MNVTVFLFTATWPAPRGLKVCYCHIYQHAMLTASREVGEHDLSGICCIVTAGISPYANSFFNSSPFVCLPAPIPPARAARRAVRVVKLLVASARRGRVVHAARVQGAACVRSSVCGSRSCGVLWVCGEVGAALAAWCAVRVVLCAGRTRFGVRHIAYLRRLKGDPSRFKESGFRRSAHFSTSEG